MKYFPIVLSSLLAVAVIYLWATRPQKIAYVNTAVVYESFDQTKEVKAQLKGLRERQQNTLDSLAKIVDSLQKGTGAEAKKALEGQTLLYNRVFQSFSENNEADEAQRVEKIWKQINQYSLEYGKEKGYAYILGANGSGNLMYADSSLNVTQDLIQYLNAKYNVK